jgi:hypothetical protein
VSGICQAFADEGEQLVDGAFVWEPAGKLRQVVQRRGFFCHFGRVFERQLEPFGVERVRDGCVRHGRQQRLGAREAERLRDFLLGVFGASVGDAAARPVYGYGHGLVTRARQRLGERVFELRLA